MGQVMFSTAPAPTGPALQAWQTRKSSPTGAEVAKAPNAPWTGLADAHCGELAGLSAACKGACACLPSRSPGGAAPAGLAAVLAAAGAAAAGGGGSATRAAGLVGDPAAAGLMVPPRAAMVDAIAGLTRTCSGSKELNT